MSLLSDAINIIKVHRMAGKKECKIPSSKLIKNVLIVLKNNNYIEEFEFVDDKKSGYFIVRNFDRINNSGAISPRFSVKKDEIVEYEKRYLPSRDHGILIITTPKGVMTNKECKKLNLGGKLLAYFY